MCSLVVSVQLLDSRPLCESFILSVRVRLFCRSMGMAQQKGVADYEKRSMVK